MNNSSYTPNRGVTAPIDPGWNDPPKLTFNSQQVTPNKPRTLLNKRVAFPITSNNVSPIIPPNNMPPIPSTIPSPIPVQIAVATRQDDIDIDGESTLKEVKTILIDFLDSSSELGPKASDIRRRIDIMEEMWITDKLDKKIFAQMKDLAHALKDDQPSKADDIHRALMINHVSSVGTWMPGIKQLIHHCIARTELLSIDKD